MSEQYLITLDEWKPKRFSLPITNTTLVKYGKLGYIVPRPQKFVGVADRSPSSICWAW